MENFSIQVQIRWADLDPNFHLRHSVYYDWGALCRVEFFNKIGFSTEMMGKHQLGPILLREECIFRKEIRSEDKIEIDLKIVKAKKDFSRFTIQHEIKKNDNVLSAIITVDFAWMDMTIRKLGSLPDEFQKILSASPKTENFHWVD